MTNATALPADGSQVAVTYDPSYVDPAPDGGYVWTGVTSGRTPQGFDFTPTTGEQPWSILTDEIEAGYVALDPKGI